MESTEYSFILLPSTISGIGVFAAHDIPAGSHLFTTSFNSRKKYIKDIPDAFIKYCIYIDNEQCLCPERFDRMEIGWYINHSDKPNIILNSERNVIAIADIKANDEILINYNQLNEPEHLKEDYYKAGGS
ncbi:MAG TPA: SET domain-containing protein [Gammaproteobacteria bacterium]|nr:SET domain-containing protein [Gammaproteobacteria bacterium]